MFQLAKAHCELNKRIYEHDKCMAEGMTDKHNVTLQVCYNKLIKLLAAKFFHKKAKLELVVLELIKPSLC